ncbi:hypothetical protein FOL47_010004 [Perkinsus chesapeaki]|uniref:Uncharacterized protein n=1 Tax=Perkinsus chesapeaki TaxID=330153 RepID=A0A7J6MR36_PERCH|nr:hypothetical protein FOL47_010004 [Perkinsus chesapeaki]
MTTTPNSEDSADLWSDGGDDNVDSGRVATIKTAPDRQPLRLPGYPLAYQFLFLAPLHLVHSRKGALTSLIGINEAKEESDGDDNHDIEVLLNRAAISKRLTEARKQPAEDEEEKYSQSDFEQSDTESKNLSTPLEAVSEMIMPDVNHHLHDNRGVNHRLDPPSVSTTNKFIAREIHHHVAAPMRRRSTQEVTIPVVAAKACPRCGGSFGLFGGEGTMLKGEVVSALGGGYCRKCKSCAVCMYVRDYLDRRKNLAMTKDEIREENAELRRWIKRLARTAELAVPAIDKLMRAEARSKRCSPATGGRRDNNRTPQRRDGASPIRMIPFMDQRHVDDNIAGTKKMLIAANGELETLRRKHLRALDKKREAAIQAEGDALDVEIEKLRKAIRALKTETSRNDRDLTRAAKLEQEDPIVGGGMSGRVMAQQREEQQLRVEAERWHEKNRKMALEIEASEEQIQALAQKEADLAAKLENIRQRDSVVSPEGYHRRRVEEGRQKEMKAKLEKRKAELEEEVNTLTKAIEQSQRSLVRTRRAYERDRQRLESEIKELEGRVAEAAALERQRISEHVRLYCSLPHHIRQGLPRTLRPDYAELMRNRGHVAQSGAPMGEDSRGASTATSERAGSPSGRGGLSARRVGKGAGMPSPDFTAIKERAKHISDATADIADAVDKRRQRRHDQLAHLDEGHSDNDDTAQQSVTQERHSIEEDDKTHGIVVHSHMEGKQTSDGNDVMDEETVQINEQPVPQSRAKIEPEKALPNLDALFSCDVVNSNSLMEVSPDTEEKPSLALSKEAAASPPLEASPLDTLFVTRVADGEKLVSDGKSDITSAIHGAPYNNIISNSFRNDRDDDKKLVETKEEEGIVIDRERHAATAAAAVNAEDEQEKPRFGRRAAP